MDLQRLPFRSSLSQYQTQAAELWHAFQAGEPAAIRLFHHHHPRFLDERIKWMAKPMTDAEIVAAALDLGDAQLALARWYCFENWEALSAYAESVRSDDSPATQFETAVEAVIAGDLKSLTALLQAHPELTQARSSRRNRADPPEHRATLLHYVAANGVEDHRQRTPKNAVAVAEMLLRAGADPNAFAAMYGSPTTTTMGMLVSSSHPAQAGVQVRLVETLIDHGASIDGLDEPLLAALIFGYPDTAKALVRRGARVDTLAKAAGLGRMEDVARMLPTAAAGDRHSAFALAALHGRLEILTRLLDAGEDPNRFNPPRLHGHATPLHHAALNGHLETVKLLVERGARVDIQDTIFHATPLGWAKHGNQPAVAEYLQEHER